MEERKIYLDVLKVFAIICIIWNHTQGEGFLAFLSGGNLISLKVALACICKTAVPLFFMCSGAVLLGKEESISNLLRKRVLKFAVILVAFSLLWYLFLNIANHESNLDFEWFFRYIYSNQDFSFSGSYWYLYAYIAFLLIVPFLRIIVKNIDKTHIKYILAIYFIFSFALPIFEKAFNLNKSILDVSWIVSRIFIYPVLGYFFDENSEKLSKQSKALIYILALISLSFSVVYSIRGVENGGFSDKRLVFAILFLTLAIFLIAKKIRLKGLVKKLITEIGKSTLGIYLLHGYVFYLLSYILPVGGFPRSLLRTIVVFVISFLLSFAFRKIPLVRKVF